MILTKLKSAPSVTSRLLLGIMLLGSIVFIGHGIRETLSDHGSTDFHSYWFYGHFIRQGIDPYQAFFEKKEPSLPIAYLDGVTIQNPPLAQPNLARTPANTAPMVLLLSVFALFSWPVAKTLWMLCNLGITLLIPWLVIKLLPENCKLTFSNMLFICLIFYCLQGTRIANWVGQTTIFSFALMSGALLTWRKSWLVAGVLLGIALSKYSLALPVFLFFLYKRRYKVIGVSLVIQVLGVLVVSLLGGNSPIMIIEHYFRLLSHHIALPGIHLAGLFPPSIATALSIIGTLIVGGILLKGYQVLNRQTKAVEPSTTFESLHILTILALWTLLVAYHRAYDTTIVIWFIALVIYGLQAVDVWRLSPKQRQGLTLFLIVFILAMSLPSSVIGLFLSQSLMSTWYDLASSLMTLTLTAALGVTLWLFHRLQNNISRGNKPIILLP